MSDASRTRTSLIEEVTPGTTPAGAFLVIPKANCTLKTNLRTVESEIIRDDANVQGVHMVGKSFGGGIATELMHAPAAEAHGLLLQAAMRNTIVAAAAEVAGVTPASGVLAATGIGTGVEVGDYVRVRTDPGNVLVGKGFYKVTVSAPNSITAPGVPDGSLVKVQRGERIKNGTTDKHFSVEHARLDTNLFHIWRGIGVARMGLTIADEQLCKLAYAMESLTSARAGTPYASGGVYTAASERASYAATKCPTFQLAGTEYELATLSLQVDLSMRSRRKVGSETATKLSRGTWRVTGTVDIYLDSWTELTKADAGTQSELFIPILDVDGNATGIALPRVRWTDITENTDRKDTDDMARFQFAAELHPTELITMRYMRWVA